MNKSIADIHVKLVHIGPAGCLCTSAEGRMARAEDMIDLQVLHQQQLQLPVLPQQLLLQLLQHLQPHRLVHQVST